MLIETRSNWCSLHKISLTLMSLLPVPAKRNGQQATHTAASTYDNKFHTTLNYETIVASRPKTKYLSLLATTTIFITMPCSS